VSTAAVRAPRATVSRRAPRHAERAPAGRTPRHLQVVDRDSQLHQRRVRRVASLGAVVSVLSVFSAVAFHVLLAQSQFELDRLGKRTATAQQRYEQARLLVASRAAPQQIVKRAQELGMVPAPTVRYVPQPPPEGGQAPAATGGPGPDVTSSTLAQQWGKVKPHLAAQP